LIKISTLIPGGLNIMTQYKMIDLCSGLKGASQPMIDDLGWDVFTVDNNPDLDPDLCIDIVELARQMDKGLIPIENIDLIWASPECVEFFKCRAPFHKDYYGNKPDMSLVNACLKIIEIIQPTFWILENTQSGSHYIKPILGNYRQKLGPFFTWGNYPLITCSIEKNHKAKNDPGHHNPLRSNIRAKVPYSVGENLRLNIERQNTLTQWGIFVEDEIYQP